MTFRSTFNKIDTMRGIVLTTAAVAAAIGLAGCSKKTMPETVSETSAFGTFTDERDGQMYQTNNVTKRFCATAAY